MTKEQIINLFFKNDKIIAARTSEQYYKYLLIIKSFNVFIYKFFINFSQINIMNKFYLCLNVRVLN